MPRLLRKCCLAVCLMLLVLAALPARTAWAANAEDPTALGSITLNFKPESGGSLDGSVMALYTVGLADYTDPAHFDTSKGQFADSPSVAGIPQMTSQQLDDSNRELSKKLQTEATKNKIEPLQSVTVASNRATFADVPQGLYLVVQTRTARRGQIVGAFLVSVPDREGNVDVIADPKPDVSDSNKSNNTEDKDGKDDGDGTDDKDKNGGSNGGSSGRNTRTWTNTRSGTSQGALTNKLARTGDPTMQAWPIALVGFGVLLVGIALRHRKREEA